MIGENKLERLIRKVKARSDLEEIEAQVVEAALRFYIEAYEQMSDTHPVGVFISGIGDTDPVDGCPKRVMITPYFGLDGFAVYEKIVGYSQPGW
jgi:hypothetical protein